VEFWGQYSGTYSIRVLSTKAIPGSMSDYITSDNIYIMGNAVAQWLRRCATNLKVAGSNPATVSGFFTDTKFFRSHYGSGVDSASNRNEYQEYFLRVNLPPSCAVVTKSGNLNFFEPSGPLRACNGTALPLPFTYISGYFSSFHQSFTIRNTATIELNLN